MPGPTVVYDGPGILTNMIMPDIRDHFCYDEFGKPAPGNSKQSEDGRINLHNTFGYTGEQWDEEAELLYLRARYYEPETGRFLSRDTYEGELENPLSRNLYAYVQNNPVNYVDPFGNTPALPYDEQVEKLQQLFKDKRSRGVWQQPDPGPVDGRYGDKTDVAWEWYKANNWGQVELALRGIDRDHIEELNKQFDAQKDTSKPKDSKHRHFPGGCKIFCVNPLSII